MEHNNPLVPPASQAHLGHTSHESGGHIIASRRRMAPLNINQWLLRMLAGIEFRDGGQVRRLDVSQFAYADPKDVYELGQVDAAPDVDPNLRFFRTKGGGVLALDAKR